MKPLRRHATLALALAGPLSGGCECVGREQYDATGLTNDTSFETTAADSMTSTGVETMSQAPADASRFLGVFHNEFNLIPLGQEVPNPGDPTIANIEIFEDGTAGMTMENCNEEQEPLEIAWRWELQSSRWLEFLTGPGEESLRFMAWTELESLRATIVDECDLQFEVDGELIPYEIFRPGKACWVNRCDPVWTVHIDYCDGEPPPCE